METRILSVDVKRIGQLNAVPGEDELLDDLEIQYDEHSDDARYLRSAAAQLRESDVPVAFPTETVYGLGADATRSAAVTGIYKAKQRPSDNPLIVHFASLQHLRSFLQSHTSNNQTTSDHDPIPQIYRSLIARFWPGPLTVILPNPIQSKLAPEVTAGLSTFGARVPRHVLATALIKLAGVPVAAPSANASTKPSPTAAEHVFHDLQGRIETIIDGGSCAVGVESTVVDGLSSPPSILRPGGISLEQIRQCPGWESTEIAYQNVAEGNSKPRAPGMKYRHYSPKAPVILYEHGMSPPSLREFETGAMESGSIGIVTTATWFMGHDGLSQRQPDNGMPPALIADEVLPKGFTGMLQQLDFTLEKTIEPVPHQVLTSSGQYLTFHIVSVGSNTTSIARGIFSALRELDRKNVDHIIVEGIDDNGTGATAAAIMNRLRKAAEMQIKT